MLRPFLFSERSRGDRDNPSFILKRYNAPCAGAFPRRRHAGNLVLIFVSFVRALSSTIPYRTPLGLSGLFIPLTKTLIYFSKTVCDPNTMRASYPLLLVPRIICVAVIFLHSLFPVSRRRSSIQHACPLILVPNTISRTIDCNATSYDLHYDTAP